MDTKFNLKDGFNTLSEILLLPINSVGTSMSSLNHVHKNIQTEIVGTITDKYTGEVHNIELKAKCEGMEISHHKDVTKTKAEAKLEGKIGSYTIDGQMKGEGKAKLNLDEGILSLIFNNEWKIKLYSQDNAIQNLTIKEDFNGIRGYRDPSFTLKQSNKIFDENNLMATYNEEINIIPRDQNVKYNLKYKLNMKDSQGKEVANIEEIKPVEDPCTIEEVVTKGNFEGQPLLTTIKLLTKDGNLMIYVIKETPSFKAEYYLIPNKSSSS